MDAAGIQAKVYLGYAIAASKLGYPFALYRPTTAFLPLSANPLTTLPAVFDTNGKFSAPRDYAKPTWRATVDGSQTMPFDYLVEVSPTVSGQPPRTFLIVAQQPMLPILSVMCEHIVNVLRPTSDTGVGAISEYNGDVAPDEQAIMTGFPAPINQGTKGEKSLTNLPGDTRSPWYVVLLPYIPGVQIETDDILTDENGNRYKISSTELSDLGWRLSAALAET